MLGRLGPVLALTALGGGALLLVLWAAMAGPVGVSARGTSRLELPRPPAASASPTPAPSASPSPTRVGRTSGQGLGWVGELVDVVVVIGLCWACTWLLRRRHDGTRRRRSLARASTSRPERVDPDAPLDAETEREALRAGLAEQYAEQVVALTRLAPRNGIVQAWVLFEEAAGRACVTRARAETTTEFVVRVLHLLDIDPAAVGRLHALYVEARFSSHEVGAVQRDQAWSALAAIHRDLETAVAVSSSVSGS